MNLLIEIISQLCERLRIALLCKWIGLTIDVVKRLFSGESLSVTVKHHSPEHIKDFEVLNVKLQLFKDLDNPDKLKQSVRIIQKPEKCQVIKM